MNQTRPPFLVGAPRWSPRVCAGLWMWCGAFALAGCATAVSDVPDQLSVRGDLERNGLADEPGAVVAIDYDSSQARGDWWLCDLRLTAMGCVGDSHVNVYVALPNVSHISGVGGADCVRPDGEVIGVFEELANAGGTGEYDIGTEVSVFVLVASDHDDLPGANFADDTETRAVSRLVSGVLRVERWADLDGIALRIEGLTRSGRSVEISFSGPTRSSDVVPLEPPATCVPGALRSG